MPPGFRPDGIRNVNSSPLDTFDIGKCQLGTVGKYDCSRRIGAQFKGVPLAFGNLALIKDKGPVVRVDIAAAGTMQFDGIGGPAIGTTIHMVAAIAHIEDEQIRSAAAIQAVVPYAANQRIVAIATQQHIVASTANQHVVASPPQDAVIAGTTIQAVVITTAIKIVVTRPAIERIFAPTCAQGVITGTARQTTSAISTSI